MAATMMRATTREEKKMFMMRSLFMFDSVSCAVDEVIFSWNRQGDKIKKGCRIGAGPLCQSFLDWLGS